MQAVRDINLTAYALSCYNGNKEEDEKMTSKYNKMRIRRRRTYCACCVVGTLSAIALFGLVGSLECDRITVMEFIGMCILPTALMVGSMELAGLVKEDK